MVLLFLAAEAAYGTGTSRSVDWWLGSYTSVYIGENEAFVAAHDGNSTGHRAITGVLHCCRGVSMSANGSLSRPESDAAFFKNLTHWEVQAGLNPVMVPVSPSTPALLAGRASLAVSGLVEIARHAGFGGYVVDYEPHANLTVSHARALATWLAALAKALHGAKKLLAVCVSDWGIIAPQYYSLLASAGADRYISMGSTWVQAQGLLTLPLYPRTVTGHFLDAPVSLSPPRSSANIGLVVIQVQVSATRPSAPQCGPHAPRISTRHRYCRTSAFPIRLLQGSSTRQLSFYSAPLVLLRACLAPCRVWALWFLMPATASMGTRAIARKITAGTITLLVNLSPGRPGKGCLASPSGGRTFTRHTAPVTVTGLILGPIPS